MIQLENVTFAYDERPILKNVSFSIDETESVVIMGPSGSGKSTILRLIMGLECPQEGKILVDDANICVMNERQKQEVRKRIAMVFQEGALFDSLTVGENVGFYQIEHTRMSRSEIEQNVRQMLGFVGLRADEIIDVLPDQLSGGMRRRVAIGRALLSTNPRVMLYDEPTTGLDPEATEMVLELINKATVERNISTVVVTHQIPDAIALANRFIVIHGGEMVFDGDLDALRVCDEPRVRDFLQPFRESIGKVNQRQFV
ncbi:ATP-binding cassette domain-containing protein [candidate division GN15 bacterium]|nr:ATP-binding cassette domain-containing protein [candidate division GN15 bacterium]